jgi:two-component system nitrogen regulation response regulator NtrX
MQRLDAMPISDGPAADRPPLVLAGRSPAVTRLRADIQAAAGHRCVLIEAEAGLEVGAIARDVHTRRSHGPFVTIECAAAEPGCVERELFGETRRDPDHDLEPILATSAVARARGGTLYLADVSELSAAAQSRLARIARDEEVSVAGTPVRLDLTLIASSQAEPDAADGRLHRELQRHFAPARIAVPPLRRRSEDIPLLVEQLIAALHAGERVSPPPVTHPAMTLLSALPWPGNLVELRHSVGRLASHAGGGVIQLEDVLTHVRFDGSLAPPTPAGTLRAARQQFERDYIAQVIRHHRGHVGEAARALGIQRTNLYRKARQLGMTVSRGDER